MKLLEKKKGVTENKDQTFPDKETLRSGWNGTYTLKTDAQKKITGWNYGIEIRNKKNRNRMIK